MNNRAYKKYFSFFVLLIIFNGELFPQAQSDSLWDEQDIEQDLYEIDLIRFKRLLIDRQIDFTDSTLKKQIVILTKQFIELANQKKFADANIILESTLALLSNWSLQVMVDEKISDLELDSGMTIETQSKIE